MNIPNALTIMRILLIPVFVSLYRNGVYAPAMLVYLLASATDVLDGYLARKWNQVTAFGKLADPLADKLMQVAMLGCLVFTGYLPWWVLAVIVVKELGLVAGSALMLKKHVVVMANWAGKAATVLMAAAVVMVFPWHSIEWLRTAGRIAMYLTVAMSLYAMVNYAMLYVKKRT